MESNLTPEVLASQPATSTEDYYRLLVNQITDYAIFLLDVTGCVATWNAGAKEIKQYSEEEIIGKHFSVFYTSEAKAEDYPGMELREARANGRFEDEGWRVCKDGTVFWANVIITAIYNSHNDLIGFSKVTRDLSARKKAEDELYLALEELKVSEQRFRLLIEGVTDYAIFMLDPAGNIATWNEGARRMKGYESYEILGKYFSKFYSPEAIEEGFPEYELKEAKRKGRFEDEGWRYRKDGSVFWANTILTAMYNAKNELIGFSKITRDLTEKRKLEQQLFSTNEDLKESEEKTKLLINSVQDYAIIMLNPDGVILSWNTGAERIKGYTASEIIGRHFSIFYGQDAIQSGFPQFELNKAIENGHFEDEGWRKRKDGTAFWANVVISPIYNSHNRLLGYAKVTRDLTERRRNEELTQKNKELIRINNELDNFVYAASHDLKSPIVNLEGLLTALQEDMGPQKEAHEEVLTMMSDSIVTLKKVIADLADIIKLQQDKERPVCVDLAELVVEVKANMRELISSSKAEITLQLQGFDSLKYSRKNLRSILFNLLSNAIKYADPKRAPKVSVSTSIAATGDYVISVADNGLGIANHQVDKIFSMFKRAHDHVEGSGIGLYLVKKILSNSGDKINVTSEEGRGSVFTVTFRKEDQQS
ncbi:PAS domain-containing sensor histidine kinase [Pontibacter qinzhouensis]|uniref:histidine kinase n=1 Tax=Pontibacter qinzhouensis TaxID=2603253 RepID=A0A5C8K9Y8_9BACT|nr:PAS domain-containing sensor histidine kinase [Pontibacter qinzhouensis]TXK48750.1 PAS domain-containing sensor histidine kinase [Pontibacter qinzhouensis]